MSYHGRGHTNSDAVLHVDDVTFAGDLVEEGGPPSFGDSFPISWFDTVGRLAAEAADNDRARSRGRRRCRVSGRQPDSISAGSPDRPERRVAPGSPSSEIDLTDSPYPEDYATRGPRARLFGAAVGVGYRRPGLEVLPVARRGRSHLVEVLARQAGRIRRASRPARSSEQADLADLHARIESDRQVGDVGQLERQISRRILRRRTRRCCGSASPAAPANSFPSSLPDQIVGDVDPLESRAQDELTGVEDEGFVSVTSTNSVRSSIGLRTSMYG